MADILLEELLIGSIASNLDGLRHVAVGASSPIPGAAALLARSRSNDSMRVSILGSEDNNFFTDGGKEIFDIAGEGRMDAFFLSGAQIDGQANINLVSVGDYRRPKARFSGSFGSGYLYYVVPRVILFRLEHTRRTLVDKVDFVSAPGFSDENVYRPGGPYKLITDRCLFEVDKTRRCFRLQSVHPGHTVNEIYEQTGFTFDMPDGDVPNTPVPDATTLATIRGPVAEEISEIYPAFAARVFGVGRAA
ncbi:MAG: 3-oxoadipate CoA-transferase subunit B [Alphaproteobacteria bacterium MarineAlpha9_Bin5]|jgi:glutaconate CoA-transferase subunit B|nr:MAG: 3-oxoadipate CoA-transferase subunit B [Alphaproteobacteria bacterium MarineAlpha9_Bin6]PPR37072.1 MAG: 3-oxoadipate CoA-transferase subunit B [Alphaproteobacteria bacterium MarineAlpha9_Bin5]HIM71566.1 CoA synthetase [Alphaproteobacteria bacterium]